MADTIGAKLKVDGESSFSKAMRDAAKNTKALDSELKLAEAQFKASGDAQKLMADRGKILKEQLSEQEKAVRTAKDMLQQLASAGYEQNSTKVMQWRQKLAQAEQSVLEINQALANNEQGLNEAGKRYDELGEHMQTVAQDATTAKANLSEVDGMASTLYGSLSSIGSEIGWSGLASGIKSINDTIDKAIKKVAELATRIWEAGVDATVWADALLTDASVYGIDQETLQRWEYASRFIDTSVETIATARKKLNANMASSNKETAESFNALHVATRTTSGELRAVDDVFWDTLASLGRMDNVAERDAVAMKVLGKGFDELKPLIDAGREAWEEASAQAPVISDENVDKLSKANDAYEEMNAQLEALKLDVLASLAPTIEIVSDAISKAAQSLREFMETPEGKAALTALENAISGLITEFTEQDFGKLVEDAAGSVADIVNSFAELLSDKDKVIQAFKLIGGAILGMKLAEAAINATSLLTNLRLIRDIKIAGATATGAAATAGAAGAGTGATVGGVFSKILGSTAAKAVGGVAAGVTTFFSGLAKQNADAAQRQAAAEAVAEADAQVAQRAEELGHSLKAAESYIASNMHEWGISAEEAKAMYLTGGDGADTPALAEAPKVFEDVDTAKAEEVIQLTTAQAEAVQKYWDIVRAGATIDQEAFAYQDLFDAFADSDESLATLDQVMAIIDSIPTSLETVPGIAEIQGSNVVIGLANGINKKASVAISAAQSLANAVMDTIASAMMIASPSKVMEQYGEYIGQGLAIGVSDTQPLVAGATRNMMSGITLTAPEISSTRYGSGAGDSVPGLLLTALSNMRLEIDGKQAGTIILPTIEDLMAEEINSRRYE